MFNQGQVCEYTFLIPFIIRVDFTLDMFYCNLTFLEPLSLRCSLTVLQPAYRIFIMANLRLCTVRNMPYASG